jgi:hypothetical protein
MMTLAVWMANASFQGRPRSGGQTPGGNLVSVSGAPYGAPLAMSGRAGISLDRWGSGGLKALCHGLVAATGLRGVEGALENGPDVLRSSEPEGLPGPVETLDVFGIRPSG